MLAKKIAQACQQKSNDIFHWLCSTVYQKLQAANTQMR